jgi:cinnamyl-alcohol dehydrogenase
VTHEHFIVKIPDGMDIQRAAPLLCTGITLWDPICYHGLVDGPKKVVGVAGLGGLGTTLRNLQYSCAHFQLRFAHDLLTTLGTMGVKFASTLGHKVVAISTSANKEAMAKEKGATGFVVTKDPESLKANAGTMISFSIPSLPITM